MRRRRLFIALVAPLVALAGCSSGGGASAGAADASMGPEDSSQGSSDALVGTEGSGDARLVPDAADAGAAVDAGSGVGLSAKYPCDKGLAGDPAVIWLEDFEEGTVSAVTSRYDSANDPPGMALVADVPSNSCGAASMKLTSGTAANATDLYKSLVPNHDEWFVRWYAKYQAGVMWHHTGMWFGGYNPAIPYPDPQAGLKPNGDDRFSIALEPVYGIGQPNPRFDFYNYWMQMHSWEDQPEGGTAYYGNALVNQTSFTEDDGTWMCLEVHVELNTDLASSTGAVLEVWKNDALVQHFDDAAPVGCWIKDKFCVSGTDGTECTSYPDLCAKPYVPLDLQWRSTSALALNAFWPQNYITEGPDGSVEFDDMVVATSRVGCLTPKGP